MYRMLKKIPAILLMFLVLAVCDLVGTKKYVIVLGLSMSFLFMGRKRRWSPDALLCVSIPVIFYLVIGYLCAVISGNIYISAIKTGVFWLLPLIFSFSIYSLGDENISAMIDAQLIGSCLAYLVINARFLVNIMKVESIFSFSFGAFLLYYVYKKRWGFVAISAFFLYMTDKRITILAAILALFIMAFLKIFRNDRRLVYVIWGIVIGMVSFYLWMICTGKFAYYSNGIGINTNGRVKMYAQVIQWFQQPMIFFGKGIGIVEQLLEAWNLKSFANLHNDLLKFYIELGISGLFLFLLSYGFVFFLAEKKFGKEKMCMLLIMSVYSMVLFATDNVSIYILYLIPYYSILFAVLSENHEVRTKDKR